MGTSLKTKDCLNMTDIPQCQKENVDRSSQYVQIVCACAYVRACACNLFFNLFIKQFDFEMAPEEI